MHAWRRRSVLFGAVTLPMTALVAGTNVLPAAAAAACPAFTAIAVGGNHTAAITASGKVWTWGGNDDGELGDGTLSPRKYPVEVPGLSGVTAIAAGNSNTLAVGPGGTVWGWGWNAYGQLGDGTTVARRLKPVQAIGLNGITQVAVGNAHALALGSNGTVYSWGYNGDGRLGDGTWTSHITPQPVPGLTGIVDIAAGDYHSMAVDAGGTAYVWGSNFYGQQGDGTFNDRSTPQPVPGISRVRGVAGGWVDSFLWTARGDVYSWGENFYGQLGDGTSTDRLTPVKALISSATAVAPGWFHTVALRGAGEVWAWGDNELGSLGDGTTTSRLAPGPVPGLSGATMVGAGNSFSVALLPGGVVKSFGWNSNGVHGDGTTTGHLTPVSPVCEAPVLTSASHSPAAAKPGNDVTFSVGWTDGVGESVHAVVCKTAAISLTGTCPGGTWATGAPTSVSPATATYTTSTTDVGAKTYWAFACDANNACSAAANGTFTVVSAQCSDGVDNDGDSLEDYPLDPGCGGELDDDESNVIEPVILCTHTRQSGLFVIAGEAVVADRPEPTIAIRLTCQLKDTNGNVVAEVTQSATGPAVALAQAVPTQFVDLAERCAIVVVTYLNRAPATIEQCVDLGP